MAEMTDSSQEQKKRKKSTSRELIEALLVAITVAVIFRSFLYEPFKIPSGSMIPTLQVGDRIFVNKFIYGLRIPLTDTWIAKFKQPKRGDVVVFQFPDSAHPYYLDKEKVMWARILLSEWWECLVTVSAGRVKAFMLMTKRLKCTLW